ncbi:MAG: sulfur carrier protein ThiS [Bacteroidetes bacterium]|nr:sulfur carrier protein ThiS [Bacteroidota bacterium]
MKITLNSRPEEIDRDSMTLEELIQWKNFTFKMLVTKVNDKLIKREDRRHTIIHDGDNVSILHLISGG